MAFSDQCLTPLTYCNLAFYFYYDVIHNHVIPTTAPATWLSSFRMRYKNTVYNIIIVKLNTVKIG